MRWLVCAALALSSARAQSIATVYLSAPQVRITSADSVQLTAVARDAAGNPVNNAAFTWTSNNAAIAKVDSSGNVQTAALGFADITATANGRQGVIRLQVVPQRIEVIPTDVAVSIGSQQHFDAVAFDSQDQPIGSAVMTWRVLVGGGSGDSATVSINSSGDVNARTLGYYVVRASVVYPSAANQFEREFAGSTTMQIVASDYSRKPLVSSWNSYPSVRLRGKRSAISVNDSGQVAFSATLDGIAGAILRADHSAVSVLASAGTPGLTAGSVFYDLDNASMDSHGTVLAVAQMIGTGNTLVLADESGLMPLLPDSAAADSVLDVRNVSINRYSLSESGDVALRANFHYPDSTVNYNGLLRYYRGNLLLEASPTDPLPGLTGTVSFDDQYGLDGNGVLYFSASAGSSRAVYRKEFSTAAVKVIATGDKLAGQVVTQLPQIAVAAGGDLVVRATLADGSQVLARYSGGFSGKPPSVMSSFPGYISDLSAVRSQSGVVWLGDAGSGYGIYLWAAEDSAPKLLLPRFGPLPSGEPVADFYSAGIDAAGSVYVTVRGVQTAWMLVRLNNSPAVIAANGSPVNATANLDLSTVLVPGDRTGPPHLLAGGNQQSIFQADTRGVLPAVLVGDTLPGGATYFGNNYPRKSPSGDLYVITDSGLHRLANGGATLMTGVPFPMSDGVSVTSLFAVAANDRKQFLAAGNTNSSHQRLVFFDGQSSRSIAFFNGTGTFQTRSPGGGIFQSLSDVTLNEAGQVMAYVNVNGGPGGLLVYDGAAWSPVCLVSTCKFDGETVTSIGALRVSNNRFCAVFNTAAGNNRLDCWESGTWTNILKRGDVTSDGTEITFVSSGFDINRKGDVAVNLNTGMGGPNIFLKTAAGYLTVCSAVFPSPDGSIVTAVYTLDLRDDRRVFFTAMDNLSRMVLYEADPTH